MKKASKRDRDKDARILAANQVLSAFAGNTQIVTTYRGLCVTWAHENDKRYLRPWETCGKAFYPVWYKNWGYGIAAAAALALLIRWCEDEPVFPISIWRRWQGNKCGLFEPSFSVVETLLAAGYPSTASCVLCGAELYDDNDMEWWNQEGVSGPCCGWTRVFRQ